MPSTSNAGITFNTDWTGAADRATALRDTGLVRCAGSVLWRELDINATTWAALCASWADLEVDQYLLKLGSFRRRRHAVYALDGQSSPRRLAHRPHIQARHYNQLFGGVERWFAPVRPDIGEHPVVQGLLQFGQRCFAALAGHDRWQCELHQFRIEAALNTQGLPTPEGMHRDGVDFVLVGLIARQNVAAGETEVYTDDGQCMARFALEQPLDTVLLDDQRLRHGVTPVTVIDPSLPAFRDVVVITYRAER